MMQRQEWERRGCVQPCKQHKGGCEKKGTESGKGRHEILGKGALTLTRAGHPRAFLQKQIKGKQTQPLQYLFPWKTLYPNKGAL